MFVTLVCMGLTPYIFHCFLCLHEAIFEHCKFAREYTHEVLNLPLILINWHRIILLGVWRGEGAAAGRFSHVAGVCT